MRHFTTIVIFALLSPLMTFSQDGEILVKHKLKNADSILLVSHEDTEGIMLVDSTGKELPLPELMFNNKPNYKIFRERKIINNIERDSLIKILERPFRDTRVMSAGCFMPHHTIFIFKNGKTSYIDICFHCLGFTTSKDLNKLYAFDSQKWTELENYFIKIGFKYELTADE